MTTLVSYVIGILFNFFTTGRFVFKNTRASRLFRFMLSYALTYGINVLALAALSAVFRDPRASQAVVVVPIAAITFLLQKFFVFRKVEVVE